MVSFVNPVFLILPYLRKTQQTFNQLDSILDDEEYPDIMRLILCKEMDEIKQLCDCKDSDGLSVFRYNASKTMSWLKRRVDHLAANMKQMAFKLFSSAHAASFVKQKRTAEQDSDTSDYVRLACGIVCSYLPDDLQRNLEDQFGIQAKSVEDEIPKPALKKSKTEPAPATSPGAATVEDSPSDAKKPKMTRAQKSLQKVDKSGMKSLTNFFTKKQ